MARIVSGQEELQDPGFAFLAGMQGGRNFGLAKNEDQRRQMALMMEIQQAMLAHKQEQAKSQALLNQQAQMGQAQALQRLALQQQMTPEQQQIEDALGMLEGIKDPKAHEMALGAIQDLFKQQAQAKQQMAAQQAIERAAGNGLVDRDTEMMRLASGEDPNIITRDLAEAEQKNTLTTMAINNAGNAIAQAQALIEAMPPGSESRLRAEYRLTEYQNSPMDQQKPGSDQELLRGVKTDLLMEEGEKSRFRRGQIDRAQPGRDEQGNKTDFEWPETYGAREFPSPMGPTKGKTFTSGKADQPRTPAMQEHIEKKRAEKEKRYPGSTKRRGGGEKVKLAEGATGRKAGAQFVRDVQALYRQNPSIQGVLTELERQGYDVDGDTELGGLFQDAISSFRESARNQILSP